MKRGHALPVGLVLAAVASTTLACASATGNITQRGPAGVVPAGLERFYGQDLSWGGCSAFATTPDDQEAYADPALQCTSLEVPLDYAKPNDKVIKVGLLRRPASDPTQRIGSLVINPGGPGGSGMSAAASKSGDIKDNELGRRFDFVGFDPRGVGSSKPQDQSQTAAEREAERLKDINDYTSPAGV